MMEPGAWRWTMEVPGVVQIHVTPSRREYCHAQAILLNNLTEAPIVENITKMAYELYTQAIQILY